MWITKTTEVTVTADGRVVGERPMNASPVIVGTHDGGYAYSGYAVPGFTELQPTGYPESPLHFVRPDKAGAVTGDVTSTMRNDGSVVSIIQTEDGGFCDPRERVWFLIVVLSGRGFWRVRDRLQQSLK